MRGAFNRYTSKRFDWDRLWGDCGAICRNMACLTSQVPALSDAEIAAFDDCGLRLITNAYALQASMDGIAVRCRSRHIPQAMREAFPAIPWDDLRRWWLLRDKRGHLDVFDGREFMSVWPLIDFGRYEASRLAVEFERLREACVMTDYGNDEHDGVLSITGSAAGWTTMTVRIPDTAVANVLGTVDNALATIEALTLDEARRRLAAIDDDLRKVGVERMIVYGSVARGVAQPGSDVDVGYVLTSDAEREWLVWGGLTRLLEATFGRVVDAHQYRPGERFPNGGVVVWQCPLKMKPGTTR